jgi:uncharacterized coiled-coil DUF342 family protein
MTTNPEELAKALSDKRNAVNEVKKKLDEVHTLKEAAFSQRQQFSSEIRALIKKIKDLKVKRDGFTSEVRDLKQKRDTTHKEIQKTAPPKDAKAQAPTPKPVQQPTYSSYGSNQNFKSSPGYLKKQMEKIEVTIETGGVSFTKEKELMKKLKQLKKEYQQITIERQAQHAAREAAQKAYGLNKEAETYHHLVMHKASESQKMHKEILEIAKQIDELKLKEKEAFDKFLELKNQFNDINSQLKSHLDETGSIKRKLDEKDKERSKEKQHRQKLSLDEMRKAVMEKLRTGGKLTNDDLKVMQMGNKE